jgi:hypothetical protein
MIGIAITGLIIQLIMRKGNTFNFHSIYSIAFVKENFPNSFEITSNK